MMRAIAAWGFRGLIVLWLIDLELRQRSLIDALIEHGRSLLVHGELIEILARLTRSELL